MKFVIAAGISLMGLMAYVAIFFPDYIPVVGIWIIVFLMLMVISFPIDY